jgi:hypothetical protein
MSAVWNTMPMPTLALVACGQLPGKLAATGRATSRATEVSSPSRKGNIGTCMTKPVSRYVTSLRRYRTQEVAGSSPASSIKTAGNRRFSLLEKARANIQALGPRPVLGCRRSTFTTVAS